MRRKPISTHIDGVILLEWVRIISDAKYFLLESQTEKVESALNRLKENVLIALKKTRTGEKVK